MNRPSKITAASTFPCVSRGVSEASEARLPHSSDGWGNQPICAGCNRGATYSCLCGPWAEDDDMMPAADVVRIMGDYFPDTGWGLAERSAYGMSAK